MRFPHVALLLIPWGAGMLCAGPEPNTIPIDRHLLAGVPIRSLGPALTSGRIADIAVDRTHPHTWYVAAGSGNLWKTVNAGTTWQPIFDHYGSYSLGCVTLDPSRRHTIWVGTGEDVSGRHVGYGDGVYRSLDGGKTFQNMGLAHSEHIARILVDPRDSETVYVAAQGPLWSGGGERGLFKSADGGASWACVLQKGPYTGVTDVVFEPGNPDVLYAATYQRHRTVWALVDGGPESGIFKSTDAGRTWQELTHGLPAADKGKIALAVSPQRPQVVYASIELAGRTGGIWRSENGGHSWRKQSDYTSEGTGAHYYQELFCDPHAFDVLYHANVRLGRSQDGGATWQSLGNGRKHVDNHAVAFHPTDPDFLLVGCDGGLYRSFDRGRTYDHFKNLPLTQFYKVAADNDRPFYHLIGGTQDNFTQYGPSRTSDRSGIADSHWRVVVGGDGYDCAIDPEDPDTLYGESQRGNLRRIDRRTGGSVSVRPQPGPGEEDLRFNWDAPLLISPHAHARLYFGSKRLHRSDDRGDSWTAISPDLSRHQDRYRLRHMDRVWGTDALYDTYAMSQYGNLTALSESPLLEGLIYAGTDDGLIQVTEDGGHTWRRVDRFPGVPEGVFVNDIKADRHDVNTVYAVLDAHKFGDFQPYLLRSHDRGRTWTSMVGDLPDRQILWRFEQDHVDPRLCFLGAEFGLYVTLDAGKHWVKLTGGVPTIAFRDIEIQRRENDLIGASFGRGFYILDDYRFLRELDPSALAREAVTLFPVRPVPLYVPQGTRTGYPGNGVFAGENPPYGAIVTYYLRDSLRTRREQRLQREARIRRDGGDTPYPGWDVLEREEREEPPRLTLVIRDRQGHLVDRLTGSTVAGLHRVHWDLHYAPTTAVGGRGPLATAGSYTVQAELHRREQVTLVGQRQHIRVVPLRGYGPGPQARRADRDYYRRVADLQRVVRGTGGKIDAVLAELDDIKRALTRTRTDDTALYDEARRLALQLRAWRRALSGGTPKARYNEPEVPSISRRLDAAAATAGSLQGPTQTQQQDYRIARAAFEALDADIRSCLEVDYAALQEALEAAGVPWTRGRPLPQGPSKP